MMRLLIIFVFIVASLLLPPIAATQTAITINHQCTYLSQIPTQWVDSAKSKLRIAYGHTSHGSQLISGMQGLISFKGDKYSFNATGTNGALILKDTPFSNASDLGNPDWVAWAAATRTYLNANQAINVVIWSWCGQVSGADSSDIATYLGLMSSLEQDYPLVRFVYMTGHLDGSGSTGNLNVRNQQIRNYCQTNNKVLFDFADIESYDPDGAVNYMALLGNDNCDYDSNGDGIRDKNWATDWQNTHTENVDWYSCSAAHSQPLNGNRKAYAAWWLWASLAGWSGTTEVEEPIKDIPRIFNISQNYPNPFNPTTTIEFTLIKDSKVLLKVYNVLGQEVATLIDGEMQAGILHRVPFDASHLSSGIYFYRLEAKDNVQMKKLVLMK
jgi:hypothetical protein